MHKGISYGHVKVSVSSGNGGSPRGVPDGGPWNSDGSPGVLAVPRVTQVRRTCHWIACR